MTSTLDSSWRSLYKTGGVLLALGGILYLLSSAAQAVIYSQRVSYNPQSTGQLLSFAISRSNLYYLQYYSAGLSLLFAFVGILALYFVLQHRDKGFALIGSSLGLLGIGIYLSNLADHLFFVQEAVTYAGGCTSCSADAVAGAAGSFSVVTADVLASIVLGIATIVLSLLIYSGHAFSRSIGTIGVLAGLVSVIAYPASSLLSGADFFFYMGMASTILEALWFLTIGIKLYTIMK